jgi:hypothetical protein
MTKIKTTCIIAILSAVIACPAFAGGQEGGGPYGPGSRDGLTPQNGPIFHGPSEWIFSPYGSTRDALNRMDRGDKSKPRRPHG